MLNHGFVSVTRTFKFLERVQSKCHTIDSVDSALRIQGAGLTHLTANIRVQNIGTYSTN